VIRVHKPTTTPAILLTDGIAARDVHCAAYEDAERRGHVFQVRRFSEVYRHPDVKSALITAQHGKCCFCESRVYEDGDVEHFRPKAGCKQSSNARMERPGYYWLAYDWENLFLCCSACNSRYKGNLFPLADGNIRAQCHRDTALLAAELPLLIDPSRDDPTDHIGFNRYDACPVNDSLRGRTTIRIMKLNRRAIRDRRMDKWQTIQVYRQILTREDTLAKTEDGRKVLAEIKQHLTSWQEDAAEFAAMCRATLRSS
jgi:uncharacterized protein (TIGR02646 family)